MRVSTSEARPRQNESGLMMINVSSVSAIVSPWFKPAFPKSNCSRPTDHELELMSTAKVNADGGTGFQLVQLPRKLASTGQARGLSYFLSCGGNCFRRSISD